MLINPYLHKLDDFRGRLGSGACALFSLLSSASVFPLQLPLFGALATELITLSACVFLKNSCAFGLSCNPPLWR